VGVAPARRAERQLALEVQAFASSRASVHLPMGSAMSCCQSIFGIRAMSDFVNAPRAILSPWLSTTSNTEP
jgi:hypothetical protein